MNKALLTILTLVFPLSFGPAVAQASRVTERGTFLFYETKQLQGQEDYEIRAHRGRLQVTAKMNLLYFGEEEKPSLTSELVTTNDLTLESFRIKGIRPLSVPVDTSIEVQGNSAKIQFNNSQAKPGTPTMGVRNIPVPSDSFAFGGYVPLAMEMMLVRYWLAHGRKASVPLLPAGEAFIESRGSDRLVQAGKTITLNRYHLSGRGWGGGWGRQTLWFDSANRLVAAVNLATDLETNLTALRKGYESNLSFFLKRAVDDGLERLTEIADKLSPKTDKPLVLLGGTIIDVTGKPAITDSAVVIQDGRIVAAGPRATISIPATANIFDAKGKYLLPGCGTCMRISISSNLVRPIWLRG